MRTYQHTRRLYPQPRTSLAGILVVHIPRFIVIGAIFFVTFYAGWAYREIRGYAGLANQTPARAGILRVSNVEGVEGLSVAAGGKLDSRARAAANVATAAKDVAAATAVAPTIQDRITPAAAPSAKGVTAGASGGGQGGAAGAATTVGRELLPSATTVVSGRMGRSSGAQLTRAAPGGTLFSWGLQEWRLGRASGDVSVPEPALRDLRVISVAASRHSAIVTSGGVVWTMGHNDSKGGGGHGSPPLDASGQLGRGGNKQPGPVGGPLAGRFVVQAVVGRYHTMAVTEDGQLYSWGLNDWGQLGRSAVGAASPTDPAPCSSGPSCHSGTPGLVAMPSGVRVVGAAAGRYVSMAVDDRGRLYTWGHDGCSNGGKLPAREEAYKPRLVEGELAGKRVVAFSAGYVFWVAATDDGEVYTCSSQDDGYAGTLTSPRQPNQAGELGRSGDPHVPGKVGGVLVGQKVQAVAAGREHALVATADGKVFSWGGKELLTGRQGDVRVPGRVLGALADDKVLFVSAGEYHSGAASETTLYGWGSNNYLCTGVGKNNPVQKLKPGSPVGDVLEPAKAAGPTAAGGWQVQAMVAGFQHVLAIAANQGGSWEVPAKANPGSSKLEQAATAAAAAKTATATKGQQLPQPQQKPQGQQQQQSQQAQGQKQQQQPQPQGQKQGQQQPEKQAQKQGQQQPQPQGQKQGQQQPQSQATAHHTLLKPEEVEAELAAEAAPVHYTDTSAPDYHTRYLAPQLQPRRYNASLYFHRFRRASGPRFELIKAEAPDVFAVLPPVYEGKYKNPCWTANGRLRCVPYFHILGVSKCGTTDLYHRLSKHPHLFKSRNKGPHWWDECPHPPRGACTAPPNGDFDGYVDLFADAAAKIKLEPQGITGEASSNTFTAANGVYLRGPSADRNTTVTISELMREATPFLVSIVIFRNPVDRYYSAYYYYRRGVKNLPPPGPEDFHKTALQEIAEWQACCDEVGQRTCVRRYHPQQLVKGMYSSFIMDWLNHWPRDQLLFLRNEDYSVATVPHMEAVFKFLEMRAPTGQEWQAIMGMETRNKQSHKYQPMLPKTRALLETFYRPFNERLSHILGDERWLWADPPADRKP